MIIIVKIIIIPIITMIIIVKIIIIPIIVKVITSSMSRSTFIILIINITTVKVIIIPIKNLIIIVKVIVLASRVSGCHVDTQTLKNHPSGHPKVFVRNF